MAKNKSSSGGEGYMVLNLNNYVAPKVVEKATDDFVLWGPNNSFFKKLNDLELGSTTNGSCIKGVNRLAYGQGLTMDDPDQLERLFKMMPKKEQKKAMKSLYVYNKCALQLDYDVFDDEGKPVPQLSEKDAGKGKVRKGKRKLVKVYYLDPENIGLGKKDEIGKIHDYWYCENWKQKNKEKFKPVSYPAIMEGEGDSSEIFYFQGSDLKNEYFHPVTYNNCLQYAMNEVEISNYHLNFTMNGLAPGSIVNFNNGDPGAEKRAEIERKFNQKKTGSQNAGKVLFMFNDSTDNAATVAGYDVKDPHKQYDFIDKLCREKILLAHTVTSPLLFGIRDGQNGLGSNAQEIVEAYEVMDEMTLKPFREEFLDNMEIVFRLMGLKEIPRFVSLAVFDKSERDVKGEESQEEADDSSMNQEEGFERTREEISMAIQHLSEKKKPKKNGVNANDHPPHLSNDDAKIWIDHLKDLGEQVDANLWEVYDVREALPTIEEEAELVAELEKSQLFLNTTPKDGSPQEKSDEGDSGLFKIRYRYGPEENKPNSRDFCVFMVSRAKSGVLYRREDIDAMSAAGVNGQFSEKGKSTYDIFRWKGGAYCHHRWYRVIFFRKRNDKGQFLKPSSSSSMENDKRVSLPQARKQGIPKDKIDVAGWPDAATRPIDTPNRGKLN